MDKQMTTVHSLEDLGTIEALKPVRSTVETSVSQLIADHYVECRRLAAKALYMHYRGTQTPDVISDVVSAVMCRWTVQSTSDNVRDSIAKGIKWQYIFYSYCRSYLSNQAHNQGTVDKHKDIDTEAGVTGVYTLYDTQHPDRQALRSIECQRIADSDMHEKFLTCLLDDGKLGNKLRDRKKLHCIEHAYHVVQDRDPPYGAIPGFTRGY